MQYGISVEETFARRFVLWYIQAFGRDSLAGNQFNSQSLRSKLLAMLFHGRDAEGRVTAEEAGS